METRQILETIKMIEEEKLDIRTITMGISLLDCIDSDGARARQKIYGKIKDKGFLICKEISTKGISQRRSNFNKLYSTGIGTNRKGLRFR